MDELDEERAIMDERASDPPSIHVDVLQEPIRLLCHREAVCLQRTATVADAIRTMQERRFGSVLVKHGDKLVGIVTERDVLYKVAGSDPAILKAPVTQIMTPDPETLRADDSIVFLMNKMHVGGFRHVPIVDEDHLPTHVISLRDVLGYLIEELGSRVLNVPSEPARTPPKKYGG